VGGLTLGGGYGVLSGKHGLTIDNWVGATIVLPSGDIVKCGIHDEDPDLFWALRGAGQNFGVIIEFVLELHPQSDLYMGTMIYPAIPEVIDCVVTATNNLYEFKEKTPSGMQTKIKGGQTQSSVLLDQQRLEEQYSCWLSCRCSPTIKQKLSK
jgi:hypothetical protein